MLPLSVVSILLHLLGYILIVLTANEENLESILGYEVKKPTPAETYRHITDKLTSGAADRTVYKPKLEALQLAYDVTPEKCSIKYIDKLRTWLESEEKNEHLLNYLKDCYARQLDTCFNDLNRKIELAYNEVDGVTRHSFEQLINHINPNQTPAHYFAILAVFTGRYDNIASYLDWQRGRRLEDRSDFDCKPKVIKCPIKVEYSKYVRICSQIYLKLLDSAGMMLYMIKLEPEREHQLSASLIEWYKKFKVAYDVYWKGKQKYKDFEKYIKSKRLDTRWLDRAKSLLSFPLSMSRPAGRPWSESLAMHHMK